MTITHVQNTLDAFNRSVPKEIEGQFFLQLTYWCIDGVSGKQPLGSLERNHPGGNLKKSSGNVIINQR